MSKIKMFVPVSRDGFVSHVDGDINWTLRYLNAEDYGFGEFRKSLGGVIFNVRHYTMFQSCDLKWQYGNLPCYVISRHPFRCPGDKNLHFVPVGSSMKLEGNEQLARLREGDADIWLAGGAELVSSFLGLGWVDEITLVRLPVKLGNGLPLIEGCRIDSRWELSALESYANGVVRQDYRRREEPAS